MTEEEILKAIAFAISEANKPGIPEWLTAFGLVFAAIGLAFTAWQAFLTRVSLQSDHERSRREITGTILQYYVSQTLPEHNKIVQLLDSVEDGVISDLISGTPISLKGRQKEFACGILRSNFPDIYERYCKNDDEVAFSHAETMQLRYFMLHVINHYEVCLAPWHLGVADEEAMERQFRSLVDLREGKYKLDKVRSIIEREKFPATESFKRKLFPAIEGESNREKIA